MLVTTKIKLDLQRPSYPVVVNAVQGEQNTRQLELSLYSGSVAWMVPDNVSVAMRYCKPDKTKGYYDTMPDGSASFTVSENRVSARLAPQMLTVPGTVVAQIVLHQGTQTLATFSIHIRVEADPSAGAETSEDYVNWAQWIQSELDAYLEQLKTNGEFLGGTFVGDVNMNGHALSGLRVPVAPDDAATKEYVDENATGAVSTVSGVAPDENGNVLLDAASVKALALAGGTMEGPINMNGQKMTGLNAPTEDSEAANKGYADEQFSSAKTYTNEQVRTAAPHNLLDNSDFRNPVNQRGKNPYTANEYTIDRWKLYSGQLTIVDGSYITVKGSLYQLISGLDLDKTYTFAAKTGSGIVCVSGVFRNGASATLGNLTISMTTGTATGGGDIYAEVVLKNAEGYDVGGAIWVALYEGEYTIDTLPEYRPKEYPAELRECMLYRRTVKAFAYCYANNYIQPIYFDPMRKIPASESITVYDSTNTYSIPTQAPYPENAIDGIPYIEAIGAEAGKYYRVNAVLNADL